MDNYILYVSDTETTGLYYDKNEIVELSMARISLENGVLDQKTWLLKANNPETISDEALKVCGHKREDILWLTKNGRDNYLDPEETLPKIENWISEDDVAATDRILVGHNVQFDFNMMEAMWNRYNSIETFPFQTGPNKLLLDTKEIALFIDVLLGKRRKYYNLGKLVQAYKIKKRKSHKADEDTLMTADLLLKQTEPFIKVAKEAFPNIHE